jgi:hypothetical protein
MPLLHGGTPFCRRQATSPGIHKFLGSVSLAIHVTLQLAFGPYAASSVLWLASLRRLP